MPYVSCIKIDGKPILPPVITPERRIEILKYKQQAIEVEERLQHMAKEQRERCVSLEIQEECSNSVNATVKDFREKQNSLTADLVDVTEYADKQSSLTSELVDVSEYADTGVKVFEDLIDFNTSCVDPSKVYSCEYSEYISRDKTLTECEPHTPRLIRSSSYTLLSPSPLLLAHLHKINSQTQDANCSPSREDEILFESNSPEKFSGNLQASTPAVSGEFMNLNISDISLAESVSEKNLLENKSSLKTITPSIEYVTTDIKVQEINITTPLSNKENDIYRVPLYQTSSCKFKTSSDVSIQTCEKDEVSREGSSSLRNSFYESDTESQIYELLKHIPEDYSSQLSELIQKLKVEERSRRGSYDSTKENLSEKSRNLTPVTTDISPDGKIQNNEIQKSLEMKKSGSTSILHDQFEKVSLPSSSRSDTSVESIKLIDLDSDDSTFFNSKSTNIENLFNINCSRELFPDEAILGVQQFSIKNWAASKICAAARGYLVRRLIKTEKVQNLIQTIKDALLCAIELHRAETIEEADVELHRRLIQQVSAACFAFHDVFFSLSIPQRMNIINIDRERKKRKLQMMRSLLEFKTTPRSSSISTRMTKSLSSKSKA